MRPEARGSRSGSRRERLASGFGGRRETAPSDSDHANHATKVSPLARLNALTIQDERALGVITSEWPNFTLKVRFNPSLVGRGLDQEDLAPADSLTYEAPRLDAGSAQ